MPACTRDTCGDSESIFSGLATGLNNIGEVRIQHHVVTDGHDQLERPLQTMVEYGQEPTRYVSSDKPAEDKLFYQRVLPGVRAHQLELDALTTGGGAPQNMPARGGGTAFELSDRARQICMVATVQAINTKLLALRQVLCDVPASDRVLSLDAEWDTTKNADGRVVFSHRIALIQIGYKMQGLPCASFIRTHKLRTLPNQLTGLLLDDRFTFTGRQLGGDLGKIGRDFTAHRVVEKMSNRVVELGMMARKRGVVATGTAGLDKLAAVLLNKTLSKDPQVRLSVWSAPSLSTVQEEYAALDAIANLEVHDSLAALPDLSVRLSSADAVLGRALDVVPYHGSVAVMAARAATGKIVCTDGAWKNTLQGPAPPSYNITPTRRLVEVTVVLAPSFVVPGLTNASGGVITLADFGSPPFGVVLPLTTLAPHVELADDHPLHRQSAGTVCLLTTYYSLLTTDWLLLVTSY